MLRSAAKDSIRSIGEAEVSERINVVINEETGRTQGYFRTRA